jgi:hypothetical protein
MPPRPSTSIENVVLAHRVMRFLLFGGFGVAMLALAICKADPAVHPFDDVLVIIGKSLHIHVLVSLQPLVYDVFCGRLTI